MIYPDPRSYPDWTAWADAMVRTLAIQKRSFL